MAALLFDLDGTMILSDDLHFEVFQELFAQRGQTIDLPFYLEQIHGRANLEFLPEFFPEEDAQALSELKEKMFRDRLGAGHPPMGGLPALLDKARAQGWQIAVVTNAPRVNAEHMLRAIGLRDRFDTLVIGEECTRAKPDPEPYLAAMRLLGETPDTCIAFEDSPSGLRAARASGAYTVGIRSAADDASLRASGAHETIQDFNDPALGNVLKRLTGEAAL